MSEKAHAAAVEAALKEFTLPIDRKAAPGLQERLRPDDGTQGWTSVREVWKSRRELLELSTDVERTWPILHDLELDHVCHFEEAIKEALRRVGRFLVEWGQAPLWRRFYLRDRAHFNLGPNEWHAPYTEGEEWACLYGPAWRTLHPELVEGRRTRAVEPAAYSGPPLNAITGRPTDEAPEARS